MNRIDKLILELLRKSPKPMSTYEIARKAKLTWSTVITHCYKLKSRGLLEEKTIVSPFGQKKVV